MNQHWAFQPLAFIAFILALLFLKSNELFAEEFCRNAKSPLIVVKFMTWAGVCTPPCTTKIPAILTSWEIHAIQLVASKLPDPNEMVKNRIEIGKISAALAAIGTPESQLMMEAIEKYDDQAKATIRSLARLSFMLALTHNTVVGSLAGIIRALNEFPKGERRPHILHTLVKSRQDAIDAWVMGLQDELRALLGQATEGLANLDGCDLHLKQVIRTSGRAIARQQDIANPETVHNLITDLFGGADEKIRPAALEAVTKLEALIFESSIAREVVGRLTVDVETLVAGIEAAYRYPDKMLAVEMTMEKEVELMVDMLRKLGGEKILVELPQYTEDSREKPK